MFQRRRTKKVWMVRGIVAAVLAAIAVVIALEPWAPYRRPVGTGQGVPAPVPTVAAPAQPAEPLAGADASSGRVIARPWFEEPVSPRPESRQSRRTSGVDGARDSGKRLAGHKPAAVRAPAKTTQKRSSVARTVSVSPPQTVLRAGEPAGQAMADAGPRRPSVAALPPAPATPSMPATPPVPVAPVQPPAISSAPVPSGQPLPVTSPAPAPSEPPPVMPLPPKAEAMVAAAAPESGPGVTVAASPATGQIAAAAATVAAAPAVPPGVAAAPSAPPAPQPWLRPWVHVPPQPPKWAPVAPRPPAVPYSPVAPLPPYFPVPWQVPAWGPITAHPAGMAPQFPGPQFPGPQPPGPVAPAPEVLVARPVGYTGLAVTVPGPAGQPQTLIFPPFAMMMALCSVPGELVKAVQRLPLQ